MTISAKRTISTWVLVLGLAAAASSALADPQPARPSGRAVTVHFADLDTSTAEGIRTLYQRIGAAALNVCSGSGGWYPTQVWAGRECYLATVEHAVARLNLPRLTALHLAKTRHGQAIAKSE
jgi:UrcA family protein